MARKGEVDVELNSGAYPRAEAECFLCKERSERIVFREAGYEAHQCDCGLLYTTPLPPPDAIDLTEDLHKKAYYDLPAALRVEFIKRYRPTGDLLEVGCGDGFFLRAAQSQGYNVAAIEPNPERAAQVRQALGVQVEEAYIETSNWPPLSRSCLCSRKDEVPIETWGCSVLRGRSSRWFIPALVSPDGYAPNASP